MRLHHLYIIIFFGPTTLFFLVPPRTIKQFVLMLGHLVYCTVVKFDEQNYDVEQNF
jgi:hypothetical protein